MPNIAFINGRYMPLSRAKVSVEDRGFQFGDGVYEVIRSYSGNLFCLEDHLDRLEASTRAIGLNLFYSRARWRGLLNTASRKSRIRNAKIYIQITRGAAPRDHSFPNKNRPTVVVTVRPIEEPPKRAREKGVSLITLPDNRWARCDIKSVNLLPNLLARQKARAARAFEALFIRDGMVMEGAGCNIFAVAGGQVLTPPKGPGILSGITRDRVVQLAQESGIPLFEKGIPVPGLMAADEVFLTGTTIEILPAVKIDGRVIGNGKPGPLTRQLYRQYRLTTQT
ncbi:MAG TPA: D-amino-acid transaminase [Nitrospiria bacterium]